MYLYVVVSDQWVELWEWRTGRRGLHLLTQCWRQHSSAGGARQTSDPCALTLACLTDRFMSGWGWGTWLASKNWKIFARLKIFWQSILSTEHSWVNYRNDNSQGPHHWTSSLNHSGAGVSTSQLMCSVSGSWLVNPGSGTHSTVGMDTLNIKLVFLREGFKKSQKFKWYSYYQAPFPTFSEYGDSDSYFFRIFVICWNLLYHICSML